MTFQPSGDRRRRRFGVVEGGAGVGSAAGTPGGRSRAGCHGLGVPCCLRLPGPGPRHRLRGTGHHRTVKDAIAEVVAGADAGSVRYKVVEGNAAKILIDESAGAYLLVVGSRGHGGFVEALLGSTGQHAVHHATCPVVVIRDSGTGPHPR